MTLNFIKPITTINGADSDNKPLHFFDKGFLLGGEHEPQYQDVTIAGQMSLTLLNAKADSLEYLKAFGKCEQKLLPDGYTQVEYIETDGNCWIEIPIVSDITTEFEITASNIISVACQLMVTQASISNNYFMIGKATATEKVVGRIGADTLNSSIDGVAKFTAKVNASSFYVNGSKIGDFTSTALDGLGNVDLFRGVYPGSTYYAMAGARVHEAIIRKSGSEVFHGIPAKNSSNVIGLYDTVTNTFLINKGSGSLTAGSTATPTPEIPQPIYCNNGILKVRSKSGLPSGYVKLSYLQSDASAYINTHFNCTSASGLKIKYRYTANGLAAISGIYTTSTPRTDALFVSSGSGTTNGTNEIIFATTNGYLSTGVVNYPLSLNTDYDIELNYKNSGEVYVNDTFNRFCGTETPNNGDILLFARKNANAGNIAASNSRIYYAIFTENQTVSKYFIPAKRNSDNVLGMYDIINDVFETNAGTGSFTAGAIDYDDYELYVDGTQETIEIDTTGDTATVENLLSVGTYKDVQEVITGGVTRNVGIKVLDGTEEWGVGATIASLFLLNLSDGGASSDFAPTCSHFIGTTVTNINMQNGQIKMVANGGLRIKDTDYTTVSQFKAFLADQYANGTPVIIVYPLQTPTTETVTGQPMTIQAGTNIIEVTQASLDDLELEAQYKAGVSVTIAEIENVNLDNSVTVTIS